MTAMHNARMLAPPQFVCLSRIQVIAIEKWESLNSLVITLNAWRLKYLLEVPSYGEALGEDIL